MNNLTEAVEPKREQTRGLAAPSFYQDRDRDPRPEPQEPSTLNKADELLKYLCDLGTEMSRSQAILFGQGERAASAEKDKSPMSLDGKVQESCTRAALLCGFLRTLNNQLAG